MPYPDTSLGNDQLDSDFGGQPASVFGVPAFTWINSVLKFLERAYLMYVRVPYATVVAVSQSGGRAGDVVVFVAGTTVLGGLYNIQTFVAGLATPIIVGIQLEPCSAGAKVRVATAGVIPQGITGLGALASAQVAGLDATSGRARVAVIGDTVLGTIDRQGQLIFTANGASA